MVKPYQPAVSLLSALAFAADKHRDQRRKGTDASPYINHPIPVAEVLATLGQVDDLETLLAAILHDTIEDTNTKPSDLEQRFGQSVAELVAEVTDDKSLPKLERKRLQIELAPQLSDKAKQIKLADKICNIRDIGLNPPADWDYARRQEYFDWADSVVLGCRGVNTSLDAYFDECVARGRESLAQICV